MASGIQVQGASAGGCARVLTPEALAFVESLAPAVRARPAGLLAARASAPGGASTPGPCRTSSPETEVRSRRGDWKVAPTPPDLQKRWVEITGPVERKMMINALNSGADVFMADFEDSLSPTWENVVDRPGEPDRRRPAARSRSSSPEGRPTG